MKDWIADLHGVSGLFVGKGTGTESGDFIGRMTVRPLPSSAAVCLHYEAFSTDHLLQHAEETTIARWGDGSTRLFVVQSESPVATVMGEHSSGYLLSSESYGPDDRAIKLDVVDGDIHYAWWWAERGRPLEERSNAVLKPVAHERH